MNSILAVGVLIAVISMCNLTDKTKPVANSSPANTNSAENRKAAAEGDRHNSNTAATDREAVKAELMRIEYEMTTASFAGDISTLARNVADEYVGTGADGTVQNKNQLLASTKPDKMTKSWKMTEIELVSLGEDSAVMTYIQSQTLRNGLTFRASVTDTFIKRDGRWLVKAEQQTLIR